MTVEEIFFGFLSQRRYDEPHLSDITWALCNASNQFKSLFLEYCFDEKVTTDEIIREYRKEDSQPDFYFFDIAEKEYIIENKIDDHGDHFVFRKT